MKYAIGTPFIHIVNPLDPSNSSYFGVITGEPVLIPDIGPHYCCEVEYFASNSKYWQEKNSITYMRLNMLDLAIHNYQDYLKDIERERTTKNR